jgi:RHS repeat-associated protein
MQMPGRKYSQTNSSYRYGFNGQEKSEDVTTGNYTAMFWEYDSRTGRRWNLDPLANQFPELSPYCTNNNNPIKFSDPTGAKPNSIHIDDKGKVLLNKNDGDNSVFVHKAGTTTDDVKSSYSATQHSAGGTKIGELGGKINLDGIFSNILQDHRSRMVNSPAPKSSWFELVLPSELPGNHPWDLKGNTKTIFGVAWAFDESTGKGKPHTAFSFNFNNHTLNLEFSSAADVGNFHAGYTAMYANLSVASQRLFAGVGEKLKNAKDLDGKNFWGNSWLSPPFMDKKADYFWNKMGMVAGDYDKKINATINPKPHYNIAPTYIDATYLRSPILPR